MRHWAMGISKGRRPTIILATEHHRIDLSTHLRRMNVADVAVGQSTGKRAQEGRRQDIQDGKQFLAAFGRAIQNANYASFRGFC